VLIQLTPNQISQAWEGLKEPIRKALVPQMEITDEAMNRILQNLLQGTSQAWLLTDMVDGKAVVYAVATTCFSFEAMTGTKNLLIYSLYGYQFIPPKLWEDGLKVIMSFAKREGCFKIIAFTLVDRVVEVARQLGAQANIRQLIWEV
jgi:hypothetical protein